jgi:hypothetical protein
VQRSMERGGGGRRKGRRKREKERKRERERERMRARNGVRGRGKIRPATGYGNKTELSPPFLRHHHLWFSSSICRSHLWLRIIHDLLLRHRHRRSFLLGGALLHARPILRVVVDQIEHGHRPALRHAANKPLAVLRLAPDIGGRAAGGVWPAADAPMPRRRRRGRLRQLPVPANLGDFFHSAGCISGGSAVQERG